MKKIVINKGYTITVVSWENDGDHNETNNITFESYEEAEAYFELVKFYYENLNEQEDFFDEEEKELIIKFVKEHKSILCPHLEYLNKFDDIVSSLIGRSECGTRRIVEYCVLTYSPEDVYTSVIFEI